MEGELYWLRREISVLNSYSFVRSINFQVVLDSRESYVSMRIFINQATLISRSLMW